MSRTAVGTLIVVLTGTAWAQSTERVSVATGGTEGNAGSTSPSISIGRHAAFQSYASNLVAGDTNAFGDVFVRDRQTGATERVSVSTGGVQADGDSIGASISTDGRYVAFGSYATSLVPGDSNGVLDIFLHDRQAGTTVRVSVATGGAQADSGSGTAEISADGRYVAFSSSATNLVPGDTNGVSDIFVRDRQAGTTERVSVATGGAEANIGSGAPSISADGRFVAFTSGASNLVPGDTNGVFDVFVRDRQAGTTERVSVATNGMEGNADSQYLSVSADGRFVAFESSASNLVTGDTNGFLDVFVRDRRDATTERVSEQANGAQGNADSQRPSISADGNVVVFESDASTFLSGDTNGVRDVYVRDRHAGTLVRASVRTNGLQGNGFSASASISADGRFVAFESSASNLVAGDANTSFDVFVHDRGPAAAFMYFCFGDGSGASCPCANTGSLFRGCQNSAGTGGARLTAAGVASLSADSVQLQCSNELPTALSIVLQGTTAVGQAHFGDGLRCAGGILKRLYVKSAVGGVVTAPQGGDPSVSARSAALGDPIALGATRNYQVYYRDADASFCPGPLGGTFNVSGAIAIAWGG